MEEHKVGLFKIFWVFAKIGAFTIGGGYAMIPLIQKEMEIRGWIDEEELPNIVALSQSAPGVLAVNISIFIGNKLRGLKGSIVATLGAILPSFIIILLIAILATNYQHNPWVIKIFSGIRPVVIALILVPMLSMAKKNNKTWGGWLISIITILLVAFLKISPIYIMLVIIVLGLSITMYKHKN